MYNNDFYRTSALLDAVPFKILTDSDKFTVENIEKAVTLYLLRHTIPQMQASFFFAHVPLMPYKLVSLLRN